MTNLSDFMENPSLPIEAGGILPYLAQWSRNYYRLNS
jgi:hypothetical protein